MNETRRLFPLPLIIAFGTLMLWMIACASGGATTQTPTPTPAVSVYSGYGFSFEHPQGAIIMAEGLLGATADETSGMICWETEEYFCVGWMSMRREMYEAVSVVEGGIQSMAQSVTSGGGSFARKGGMEMAQRHGQDVNYQLFELKAEDETASGAIASFYLNEAERGFFMIAMSPKRQPLEMTDSFLSSLKIQ